MTDILPYLLYKETMLYLSLDGYLSVEEICTSVLAWFQSVECVFLPFNLYTFQDLYIRCQRYHV